MVKYRPPEGAARRARRFRRNLTDAERRLWWLLRETFPNARFGHQVPLRDFTVDFASHSLKLVIEVDGGQHGEARDAPRTALIEAEGYRVLRFWNHEVLGNADEVMTVLASYCTTSTPTLPSPIKGEGKTERG